MTPTERDTLAAAADATLARPDTVSPILPALDNALEALADQARPIEDRAALYASLHAIQLRITRALREPATELTRHLSVSGTIRLGPIRLKPAPATFPCNDPGNWTDSGVQDALRALASREETRSYVRRIPDHYELDTAALRDGYREGAAAARDLYRQLNAHGWRVPGRPDAGIQVAER